MGVPQRCEGEVAGFYFGDEVVFVVAMVRV